MTAAALAAFLVRLAATAGIVVAVTLLVDRLGPRIGGVVAGLPIVVGPGLAFIALDETPSYLGEAAGFVLVSLTATAAFLLAYGRAARQAGPAAALLLAIGAWAGTAILLAGIGMGPVVAAGLFALASLLAARLLRRAGPGPAAPPGKAGRFALFLRAGLAGALVGAVSLASRALGPELAGILLAYPIGMTVIAVTIHQRQGSRIVIATLAATALGSLSIGAFALAVALLAPVAGGAVALAAALGAALLVSLLLLALGARRRAMHFPGRVSG